MTIINSIRKIYCRTLRRVIDVVVKKIVNCYYPYKFSHYKKKVVQKNRDIPVIVSLTSFPKRIEIVHYVIESLLMQSEQPDKIVLCLKKIEYPNDYVLPKNLSKLLSDQFEILWVDENLMPHGKYLYAMQKYPEAIIITVDDDGFYRKNFVRKLLKSYKKHPTAVSCLRSHKIRFDKNGNIMPYNSWIYECVQFNHASDYLLATGVGGVLYPPHALDKRAFDKKKITELCLKADDIWLKAMEILNGTKVVNAPVLYKYVIAIEHAEEEANLMNDNVQNCQNDIYLRQVFDEYNIGFKDFQE